jgi:hypothetical protein
MKAMVADEQDVVRVDGRANRTIVISIDWREEKA